MAELSSRSSSSPLLLHYCIALVLGFLFRVLVLREGAREREIFPFPFVVFGFRFGPKVVLG